MDSTQFENFTKLFQHALEATPENGGGFGVALATNLGAAALAISGVVILFLRNERTRDRLQREQKSAHEEEVKYLKELGKQAKVDQEVREQKAKEDRIDQRSHDADIARERARADQSDRESARDKLIQHVTTVVEKLNAGLLGIIQRIETALGVLQGRVDANAGDIVSLSKDVERLQREVEELRKSQK